jgi:hypothetical protein
MKQLFFIVLVVTTIAGGSWAQAPADKINTPLLAAPEKLQADAGVIAWKSDYTYDTLRKSTNGIVCYDLSGRPLHRPFTVECTSTGNLPRVAQNLKLESGGDKVKTQALLDAAEKDGTRVKPQYGSVWYHFMGPDREHAGLHMTIALPGATTQSTGLPDNPKAGGVWLMNAGTTTAHLMTPGE